MIFKSDLMCHEKSHKQKFSSMGYQVGGTLNDGWSKMVKIEVKIKAKVIDWSFEKLFPQTFCIMYAKYECSTLHQICSRFMPHKSARCLYKLDYTTMHLL